MSTSSLENRYAVVAAGGVFPDANELTAYWKNIVDGVVSIKPIPEEALLRGAHYNPEALRLIEKNNKSYTVLGARIDPLAFNSTEFKIPPSVARHMDSGQKLMLLAVRDALKGGVLQGVDKEKVSVIVGTSGCGEMFDDFQRSINLETFLYHLQKQPLFDGKVSAADKQALFTALREQSVGAKFPITEDSAPGVLPNVIPSRICSVFDFHGRSFVIDTACASALAGMCNAFDMLDSGESDAVICGAVDILARELGFILFSGINALSPNGSFPFDKRADGFIIGQGGGVVVLKRLHDALANNNAILAVVAGRAYNTDGKGKAIAAPNTLWQAKSIEMAYKNAAIDVDTIGCIEAHGTATKVGDVSEVSALKKAFTDLGATKKNYCGLSSVKSNIGHLRTAAGIAGFLKVVLALKNKVLPPVAGFQTVNPQLQLEDSPFYIIDKARAWPEASHPRRAGVSAFGFGGVNYHLVLEEYREADYRNAQCRSALKKPLVAVVPSSGQHERLCTVSAADPDGIKQQLLALKDAGFAIDAVRKADRAAHADDQIRLSFSAAGAAEWQQAIEKSVAVLENHGSFLQLEPFGIYYSDSKPCAMEQVALVFPGQGAQYAGMLQELVEQFPSVANTFVRADKVWESLTGKTVSELIFAHEQDTTDLEALLKDTRNTHPAIFTADYALYTLLSEMGLNAPYRIGHSAGELVALASSGAFTFQDGLRHMEARSRSFGASSPSGGMLAISATAAVVQQLISRSRCTIWLANRNSPLQTIVSGTEVAIETFSRFCKEEKIRATRIPVGEAFHSPLVAGAGEQFAAYLKTVSFKPQNSLVMSNETADFYPQDPAAAAALLSNQITASVRFTEGIEKLYQHGVRLFVEVGPGSILANIIKSIIPSTDVNIVSTNFKKRDGVESFYRAVSQLFAIGIKLEVPPQTPSVGSRMLGATVIAPEPATVKNRVTVAANSLVAGKRTVVYSGAAVGLPGSYKDAFRDDNFEQLFAGKNCIERLTDGEKQRIVDLQVRKLFKSEKGASYKELDTLNDVIQFVGRMGRVDFAADFGFDPKELATMSSSIAHGVAVGYEAIKDAQIPLVHQYIRTTSGAVLPERWTLPQSMQKRTGVIFANGFPMIDPVIEEVSKQLSYHLGSKLRKDIFAFYDSLIEKVRDSDSRKILADWYALNYARFSETPSSDEVYQFNHQFMTQLSSQANNRLARYLGAQGPNFLILAACSSTSTAITLSEEMIQSGRVDRMIVIGADDTANQQVLPFVGAGFLSTGAASNRADLYEVAVPFDKRRNGMIMGSGSVGIVIEALEICEERGVIPVAELVGTHCFNTTGHPSQLDIPQYADELAVFVKRLEGEGKVDRKTLPTSLVYVSHEPCTPPKGGCSQSEAVALQHVFGEKYRRVIVTNTKGMTGHTMGAALEDAVAAKCLQFGKTPPIVNYQEQDPLIEGLLLSRGEAHSCQYALRMAAGFGSQGNYLLLKKSAHGEERISNPEKYRSWLAAISNQHDPRLIMDGNRLIVEEREIGVVVAVRPQIPCFTQERVAAGGDLPIVAAAQQSAASPQPVAPLSGAPTQQAPLSAASQGNMSEVTTAILSIVSAVSGYPVEMLSPEMEFEADLGIDTVKQATILAQLAEMYDLQNSGAFAISDYPTPQSLITLICRSTTASVPEVAAMRRPATEPAYRMVSDSVVREKVFGVVSAVSGYPVTMLDEMMEFEADLGIDTVKQATILGMLADTFTMETTGSSFAISEFPSIRHLVELFSDSRGQEDTVAGSEDRVSVLQSTENSSLPVENEVMEIIAGISGYPVTMLEKQMEFEADLGIDTVKQATILGEIAQRYGILQDDAGFQMSAYPTIGHLVALVKLQHGSPVPVTHSQPTAATVAPVFKTTAEFSPEILSPTPASIDQLPEPGAYIASAPAIAQQELISFLANKSDYDAIMLEPQSRWHELFGFDEQINKSMTDAVIAAWSLPATFTIGQDESLAAVAAAIAVEGRAHAGVSWNFTPSPRSLSRQVVALDTVEPAKPLLSLRSENLLLLAQSKKCGDIFAKQLEKHFASVTTFIIDANDSFEKQRETIVNKTFATVLDTTLLDGEAGSAGDGFDYRHDLIIRAFSVRLDLFRALEAAAALPTKIVALLALDGTFGLGKKKGKVQLQPEFGLFSGFYKALSKEWQQTTRCTSIDIGTSWKKELAAKVVKQIISEIAENLPWLEVCYGNRSRQRVVVEDTFVTSEQPATVLSFTTDDTILVTGGGSGITAAFVKALSTVCTTNFAILGRTQLDADSLRYKAYGADAWNALKVSLKESFSAAGRRVTPVIIEQEISRLKKSLALYDLIETVQNNGSGIKYYRTDLQNHSQVQESIAAIKRERKQITALVHGAGIEISHLLQKKSNEEFIRVLGPKVFAVLSLEEALAGEPLKRVLAFSSISGRFGNAAQLDYAAANDYLNVWVRSLNRQDCSAISCNWSGWDKIGMAVQNTFVKEQAEKMGLHLIDPDDALPVAVAAFLDPMQQGEHILHRGLGPMNSDASHKVNLAPYPFIDRFDTDARSGSCSSRVFSPKRDLFLSQHRLNKCAIMPGVAYMEMMAEHYALLEHKELPLVYKNMQYLEACKFYKDVSRDISLLVTPGQTAGSYSMAVKSFFKGKNAYLNRDITHCTATIAHGTDERNFTDAANWQLEKSVEKLSYAEMEQRMPKKQFNIKLGPLFDDMNRPGRKELANEYSVGVKGYSQTCWMPFAQIANEAYPLGEFIINPSFLDSLHQAGAVYSQLLTHEVYLPVGAEEFGILHLDKIFSQYTVTVLLQSRGDDTLVYNILSRDATGKPCMYIKGSTFRRISQ